MTADPASPAPKPGDAWKARAIIGALVAGLLAVFFSAGDDGDSNITASATTTYKAAAKELVKQQLRDPGSAEFSDLRVVEAKGDQPTIVCGRVNSRNGFGGMAGVKRFVVGGTVAIEEEASEAQMNQLWATYC